jgi:type III secretion system low calcium response chaperone LcrH/SycD
MPKGGASDFANMRLDKVFATTGKTNEAVASQLRETVTMMYEAIKKGIVPKKMLNLEDETLEGIYTQAYLFYNQGKYRDAAYLFCILMMLDPNQPKFMLGSGACLHRLEKYEKAAQIYILCSTQDQANPLPHFHAADCYIKLKALPLAEMCLKNAIQCCGDKKEYALIKERAQLMLEAAGEELEVLEKQLREASQDNEES